MTRTPFWDDVSENGLQNAVALVTAPIWVPCFAIGWVFAVLGTLAARGLQWIVYRKGAGR